jgi:hypothetical protein
VSELDPGELDEIVRQRPQARAEGDDRTLGKILEREIDELLSEERYEGPTEAQLEEARRADHAFRSALSGRLSELLRGQGFTRCRVNCAAREDDDGFHEQRYVIEAFDSGAHYELTVERPTKPDLGIEHTKVFLHGFADRIALELLKAREARRPRRVVEVAQA